MEADAFEGEMRKAGRHQEDGRDYDAICSMESVIYDVSQKRHGGFLSSAEAADRYEQVYGLLLQVSDDRVTYFLGQAYWFLGSCSLSLALPGNDISAKCLEQAELCGWDDYQVQMLSLQAQASDMEDYREGIALLRSKADEDPGAWYYVGELAMDRGEDEEAEEAYQKVPKVSRYYTSAQMTIAQIKEMNFDRSGVGACYDNVMDSEPWNQRLVLGRLKNQLQQVIEEAFDWNVCYPGSSKVESLLDEVLSVLSGDTMEGSK